MSIDSWLDVVRREAQHVVDARERKSTLVATGYNPDTHSVKGILVPHGVETGWVPIATHGIGNGWGIVVGPKVGDPQKLDGDQFDVEFEFGDPNTPVARHRVFSNPDKPPVVQSGEILLKHESLGNLFFKQDNSVLLQYKNTNTQLFFDSSGVVHLKQDSGSEIQLDTSGDIAAKPAANKFVYLGGIPGDGSIFDLVKTVSSTALNVKAKIG
jgi:hypothetical protein